MKLHARKKSMSEVQLPELCPECQKKVLDYYPQGKIPGVAGSKRLKQKAPKIRKRARDGIYHIQYYDSKKRIRKSLNTRNKITAYLKVQELLR